MNRKFGVMVKKDVCATIISYNDFSALEKTVSHVLPQVDKVLIIDNKSDELTCDQIKSAYKSDDICVIFNDENFGIARAYNQAVEYCEKNKYKYIFTLDQDSLIDDNCINSLMNVYKLKKDALIVVPSIVNNWEKVVIDENNYIKEKTYAISSGNLININTFKSIGKFNEMLFIDSVDFDFSLRVINSGGKIYECKKTQMLHRLGKLYSKRILGIKIKYTYHNNLRNYYIYRNSFFIIKTYLKTNKVFCIKRIIMLFYGTLLNLLFNADRKGYLKGVYTGIKDGVNNSYGPRLKI